MASEQDTTKMRVAAEAAARKHFDEGYAAGHKAGYSEAYAVALADFQRPIDTSAKPIPAKRHDGEPKKAPPALTPLDAQRMTSGKAKVFVLQVLKDIAPQAASQASIKRSIITAMNFNIADTTLRRAITHLEKEGLAEQDGDVKEWRYKAKLRSVS